MKTKKKILLFAFIITGFSLSAYDVVGHRIIAKIAYQNLSKKAKEQTDKILYKEGIVYESGWADEIKSDSSYAYSYQWHYQNLADSLTDSNLQDLLKNPSKEGKHLFYAIESLTNRLKENKYDAEALKFLVHFVGDLHQPMHLGRKEDLGGNKIEIKWFGKSINIHSLWDSYIIESTKMTFSEYSTYLINKYEKEKNNIQRNSLLQSIAFCYSVRNKIYSYDYTTKNNYLYTYLFADKQDELLYRGGIQLANILNDIYK